MERRAASLWYICGNPFWSRNGPAAWRYAIKAVTALALALKIWLRCLACFLSALHELCKSQLQETRNSLLCSCGILQLTTVAIKVRETTLRDSQQHARHDLRRLVRCYFVVVMIPPADPDAMRW